MKTKEKNLTPDELAAEITRLDNEAAARLNERVEKLAYIIRRQIGRGWFKYTGKRVIVVTATLWPGLYFSSMDNEFKADFSRLMNQSGFYGIDLSHGFWGFLTVTCTMTLAKVGTPADAAPAYDPYEPDEDTEPLNVSTISPVDPIYSLTRPAPAESERFGLVPPTDGEIEAALTQQMESGVHDILTPTIPAEWIKKAQERYTESGYVAGVDMAASENEPNGLGESDAMWDNTPLGLSDDPEPDDSTY